MFRRLLFFFIVGALLGAVYFHFRSSATSDAPHGRVGGPPTRTVGDAITAGRENAIVRAVQRVSDAVVTVATVSVRERPFFQSPFGDDDFFSRLFSAPGRSEAVPGLGSGVIVDGKGIVLTNEHVIRDTRRIEIVLPDGRVFEARVLGKAPDYDLAVLQIEAPDGTPFVAAPLGDSESLIVGEWAIAIGNPFGYQLTDHRPSVTVGVVSAINREVKWETATGGIYKHMIQTDAPINPGNSGGALVNALGEVIGINTFIFSTTGGSIGLGFAIPIHIARRIMNDILQYGKVRQVWIGLEVMDIDPRTAYQLGIRDRRGLLVWGVDPGSPADRAGIQRRDIIRGVDRKPITSHREAERAIFGAAVGDRLTLQIDRGGELREFSFILEEKPTP